MGLVEDSSRMALLASDDLRAVHRFLLDQLLFAPVQRLKHEVSDRLHLPGLFSYLAPLLAGVFAGTLLVLDLGTAWNEVLTAGHRLEYYLTVGIALVASFGLVAGGLGSRMRKSGERQVSGSRWLAKVVRRVLPIYTVALAMSFSCSTVILFTLLRTTTAVGEGAVAFLTEAVLWSSLSLFLGLFLGLVLQGRGLARRH